MAETEARQWTIVLILTALLLSLIVLSQILTTYITAYRAAPSEITSFIDAVDFSVEENESYGRDVAKVQLMEDRLRLNRLLREIQKGGDDLREQINSMLLSDDTTTLHTTARLLWASRRRDLEERVRRLDLVRMRFLVVYMGVVAEKANATAEKASATAERQAARPTTPPRDPEKAAATPFTPPMSPMTAGLMGALNNEILQKVPLRSVDPEQSRRMRSCLEEIKPKLHMRRTSLERADSSTSH